MLVTRENKNTTRGVINLEEQVDSPLRQFAEAANWPSIASSNKVLQQSGKRKIKFSKVVQPAPNTGSFKFALCGSSTIANKSKIVATETSIDISNDKPKAKSEINYQSIAIPENEWISVSHKKKNKNKMSDEQENSLDKADANIDKIKKREQLKLKKRQIREQKIQEEKDMKRRDTKINVVSQDIIDSYHQKGSSRSAAPKYIVFNDSASDLSLENSQNITKSTSTNKISSTIRENRNYDYTKKVAIVGQQQSGKKKVKTKDLISLNIVDLIKKSVRKSVVPPPAPKREKTIRKEKPGKQSDIKKIKKSTLKKNITRGKKISQENFALYLGEIFQDQLKISQETVSPIPLSEQKETILPERSVDVEIPESEVVTVPLSEQEPSPVAPVLDDTEASLESESKEAACHLKTFQTDLIKEINYLSNPLHSRKFREYCSHFVTHEINEFLIEFIELIVKFQVRLYENDPIKGRAKRRFYCGLKESWKHVNKLTCVVVAPDIKCSASAGGLDELLKKILDSCEASGTSVIFGLNQFKLGRLTRRKCNVCCIGITNFQGAQEVHKKLMAVVCLQKEKYQNVKKSLTATQTDGETLN